MDPELRVIYSCDVWVEYRPASAKGDGIYDKLRHSICEISTVDYIPDSMIRDESIVPVMYCLEFTMHAVWNTHTTYPPEWGL